jgi:predicted PurR-regulated permease PerM/methylmalonyl-CoA mutase cobalamin-binding subunit
MSTDWQRSLMTLAATVVTAVIVLVLYWARSIFIPVALAIFLAFVLSPIVSRLQRRGLGRSPAVILTVGIVLLASIGIGAIITHQVVMLADTLPDRKDAIKEKVANAKMWLVGNGNSRFGQLVDDVTGVIAPKRANQPTVAVEPASPSLSTQLDTYVSPAAEVLGQAAFTFILTVYMLIRREDLRNRMIRLLGDGKVTTTTKAVDEASRRISRYLLMQLTINSCFGVIITLGLVLLGVKYAPLWGFIATVMRYIPYVGTWIGLIPPVLFSFATAPGWGQPLAVLVLFLGLEAICNNIFEPWLYGTSMGLSEVAQLVAAAFWAFLWGPIGLILSGPLTACLLVLGKHVRKFGFLEVMLGDEPALESRVAFYQRLTARDQDEAALVALEVAKKAGPDAALETVVVPALCLARRDLDDGDLDPADFRFAVHAAREIAAEVEDLREQPEVAHDGDRARVLVVPARDEAEHVAAGILAGGLDHAKWEVRVAGDETLASELVAAAEEFQPAVVVVTALPPGGMSHCRYLVNRVRAKCPGVKVLVGRWGCGEPTTPETIDGIKGADGVDRSLAETRKRLAEMHPVLVAEVAKHEKPGTKRALVGTVGA